MTKSSKGVEITEEMKMVPARSMPLRVEPTTRMAYTSSSDNSEDETREPRCGET